MTLEIRNSILLTMKEVAQRTISERQADVIRRSVKLGVDAVVKPYLDRVEQRSRIPGKERIRVRGFSDSF